MKVCILDNGITSLTLAKALVNQKIYVDIISNKNSPTMASRTIGISRSNVEFFNSYILNIDKIIWKLKKIEIFTDNLKNEKLIDFEDNKNYLFSIVKNSDLYQLLKKDLVKNKYFKQINLNKNLIFDKKYNLIINTNYFSPIAKKYFHKKILKKYNSFAFTTTIKHEKILNETASQIFTQRGPLAFLPISNFETSVVYSLDNLKNIKDDHLYSLIKKYNLKYKIKGFDKIQSIELISSSLRSYYHENILAFGDMLHKIHPLAGQGFNMTIRDIKILINIITKKIDLGLPINYLVNQEFESKCKSKNYIFSNGIDYVYEFFNFERKTHSKLLSKSVKLLCDNSMINKFFTRIADRGINY